MKKCCLMLILCLCLSISSGCGNKTDRNTAPEATTEAKSKTVQYQSLGLSFSLPEGWSFSESDDNKVVYYDDANELKLQIMYYEGSYYSITDESTRSSFKESISGTFDSISEEQLKEDAYLYDLARGSKPAKCYMFDGNNGLYQLLFVKSETSALDDSSFDTLVMNTIDTIELIGEAPTTTEASTTEATTTETTEASNSIYDDDIISYSTKTYSVGYTRHEFGENYDGKDVLYYFYEFENLGEDTIAPMSTISLKAYQNGVELETAVSMDAPEESQNLLKSIKTGGKIEVCVGYVLDDDSDVTIECDTLFSSEQPDTQVIKIK